MIKSARRQTKYLQEVQIRMKRKLCLTLMVLALVITVLPLTAAAAPDAAAPERAPVTLAEDGKSFTYGEKTYEIGPHAVLLDGSLSDERIAGLSYVYNTFNEAIKHLTDGTKEAPTYLYIAPNVYWIHDPKAESTEGLEMFSADTQLHIDCEELHIVGLTEDARNVVIAANFGHDLGLMGANYTMIYAEGDGLTLENLTFGDYCNVDLVYPLDPAKNVPARNAGNITQGQIASYGGDRLFAKNVRFVSRLNMMPFISSRRALYVDCHLESTADSLNGSAQAVYLNCDFEFYSSKPWGASSGAVILGSTMKLVHQYTDESVTEISHYMVKGAGPMTIIDSEFVSHYPNAKVSIGWSDVLGDTYRSYLSNVTHNGLQIAMDDGGAAPDATVDLTGTDSLKAFKFTDAAGKTVYNIYNLLAGSDGWDPLGQKAAAEAAGAVGLPTWMTAGVAGGSDHALIESGNAETEVDLVCKLTDHAGTDYGSMAQVTWSVKAGDEKYVTLTPAADGTCHVAGINETDETVTVIVTATDASGLKAAVSLTVRPSILPAPVFAVSPSVTQNADGTASVSYTFTAESTGGRADLSRVTWYLSRDGKLDGAIKIAEDRRDTPLASIPLDEAYIGQYLIAVVEPRNIRSEYGQAVAAVSQKITAEGVKGLGGKLSVDIGSFPVDRQPDAIPGFWTVDSRRPSDTEIDAPFQGGWKEDATVGESRWAYATGVKDGVKGYSGLINTGRGSHLMYTPLKSASGDMSFTVLMAPGKTAGQGFGSANQYLDLMIKYDTTAMTGYGLRIYRKTGSSCSFVLVQHRADGTIALISDEIESGVLLTECTAFIRAEGDTLSARITSNKSSDVVELTATVPGLRTLTGSGVALQHTGTGGDNSIYFVAMDIAWAPDGTQEPAPQDPALPATYTVQKGDTLQKIAKKIYGDKKYWSLIYNANRDKIRSANLIYVGQVLTIPAIPGAPAPEGGKPAAPGAKTYTVQKGDTLSSIAKKLLGKASKWRELYEANTDTVKNPNRIYAGQVLKIPD